MEVWREPGTASLEHNLLSGLVQSVVLSGHSSSRDFRRV
jgi:hypothetical protein